MCSEDVPLLEDYDWESLRKWCLWYVRVFLEWASGGPEGTSYAGFDARTAGRMPNWKQIRKLKDPFAKGVVDLVVSWLNEASVTRSALPGDFTETVEVASAWEKVLQEQLSSEEMGRRLAELQK